MYKLLNTTQRLSRAQAERVDLQSNVRTAALVVPTELRELNTFVGGAADRNDITVAEATRIQYRAMRSMGFVCQTGTTSLRIRKSTWSGFRDPVAAKDAAYVFVQNAKSALDVWQQEAITAVSTANNCLDGQPAYTFTINPALAAAPPIGTPVRTFEVMELKLYDDAGKSWLGARSVSGGEANSQPLLGPLRAADGLSFTYLNAAGAATATLGEIKSVALTVRGETTQRVSTGGGNAANAYMQDSLVTQVSLRNAFRP
jgi:hypothetical protein